MRDTMAHLNLMSWTNKHKKLHPPSDRRSDPPIQIRSEIGGPILVRSSDRRSDPDPIGDWRVLVKGIHPACTKKHLHKICAKFGQVTGIVMPVDKMRDGDGGTPPGPTGPDGKPWPATVHFNRREDAEECVRMIDGRFIGGWIVHLTVTNPLRDRGRPVRMWPPQWQYRKDLPGIVPPP